MNKEICECGHSIEDHLIGKRIKRGKCKRLRWDSKQRLYMPCKKKCKKFKDQNHSPFSSNENASEDKPSEASATSVDRHKSSGGFNLSEEREYDHTTQVKGKMTKMYVYREKDVKEFIKIDYKNTVLAKRGEISWQEYARRRTFLLGKEFGGDLT